MLPKTELIRFSSKVTAKLSFELLDSTSFKSADLGKIINYIYLPNRKQKMKEKEWKTLK